MLPPSRTGALSKSLVRSVAAALDCGSPPVKVNAPWMSVRTWRVWMADAMSSELRSMPSHPSSWGSQAAAARGIYRTGRSRIDAVVPAGSATLAAAARTHGAGGAGLPLEPPHGHRHGGRAPHGDHGQVAPAEAASRHERVEGVLQRQGEMLHGKHVPVR